MASSGLFLQRDLFFMFLIDAWNVYLCLFSMLLMDQLIAAFTAQHHADDEGSNFFFSFIVQS